MIAGIIILSTKSGASIPVDSADLINNTMFSRSPSIMAEFIFSGKESISSAAFFGTVSCLSEKYSINFSALFFLAVSTSPACLMFMNSILPGLAMAAVRPLNWAMAKNAALSQGRPGIPNDTLDKPKIVLLRKISVHQRKVLRVSCAAPGLEATAITRQSTIKSSFVKPCFRAEL